MKRAALHHAVEEADRFKHAAMKVLAADAEDHRPGTDVGYTVSTRLTAACRRASLDLTRALADLRRREP